MGNSESLPLVDVTLADTGEVQGILSITSEVCDNGHSTDSNYSFKRQIGLVAMKIN